MDEFKLSKEKKLFIRGMYIQQIWQMEKVRKCFLDQHDNPGLGYVTITIRVKELVSSCIPPTIAYHTVRILGDSSIIPINMILY